MTDEERERRERGLCLICGKPLDGASIRWCKKCGSYYNTRVKSPTNEREEERQQAPKKKHGETLDDIARKAHKHGLSYGKYLEARARGMYLSEVEE